MPKKARMRRKHYSRKSPEKLAPLAKRLRLSNPNMTTDTTPDANIDQEDSIEHANPKLFEYATPLIFAFPTNLAVGGEFASFRYDCTPWLAERLKDLRLLWRIVDFAHKYRREGNKATPILLLGAALHVQFYAVFPHLETIGETAKCGIFKKWHDEVMHPAFSKTIASRFHYDQVPHKHKSVLLHSGGIDPGDPPTPIDTLVRRKNLPVVWNAAVRKTTQPGFEEYKDVFLVAVFDHLAVWNGGVSANLTGGKTSEASLFHAMELWEQVVDMRYVPKGHMEYRVESTWRI